MGRSFPLKMFSLKLFSKGPIPMRNTDIFLLGGMSSLSLLGTHCTYTHRDGPHLLVMVNSFVSLNTLEDFYHTVISLVWKHSQSLFHGVLSFIFKETQIKLIHNCLLIGTLSQSGGWVLWSQGSCHTKLWILVSW